MLTKFMKGRHKGHAVCKRGNLAPWVNPRHGCGPRDQVTALAHRGTFVSTLHELWSTYHNIPIIIRIYFLGVVFVLVVGSGSRRMEINDYDNKNSYGEYGGSVQGDGDCMLLGCS